MLAAPNGTSHCHQGVDHATARAPDGAEASRTRRVVSTPGDPPLIRTARTRERKNAIVSPITQTHPAATFRSACRAWSTGSVHRVDSPKRSSSFQTARGKRKAVAPTRTPGPPMWPIPTDSPWLIA